MIQRIFAACAVVLAVAASGSAAAGEGAHGGPSQVDLKQGEVTFDRDIAPIVYQNCATCHHEGEVAPFPLVSYEDLKKRAMQIGMVTQSRFMPPWKADSHGEFLDERRLTDDQIGLIHRWVNEGAPEGNPSDLPPKPQFRSGWALGAPDAVLDCGEPYSLAADGRDVYRCFVIPTNYNEDRYVSAIEVRPGNRTVVHHVIAYLDTSGAARQLDAADPGPGYSAFGGVGFPPAGTIGGWAPGNTPRRLPDGVGILLPKGADIVLQVHYHKSGKPETDLTKIAIYFCNKPVDKKLRIRPLLHWQLQIPAGDSHYTVQQSLTVPRDATLLSIMPHMHLLGQSMVVTATFPDGKQRQLVNVPNWDFNWQTTYAFKDPIKLPQGTQVSLTATYDNSANNPRNPNNPPRLVTWGEQTTDEMCIAFLFYTLDSEHLTQGVPAEAPRPAASPLQQRLLQWAQRVRAQE